MFDDVGFDDYVSGGDLGDVTIDNFADGGATDFNADFAGPTDSTDAGVPLDAGTVQAQAINDDGDQIFADQSTGFSDQLGSGVDVAADSDEGVAATSNASALLAGAGVASAAAGIARSSTSIPAGARNSSRSLAASLFPRGARPDTVKPGARKVALLGGNGGNMMGTLLILGGGALLAYALLKKR